MHRSGPSIYAPAPSPSARDKRWWVEALFNDKGGSVSVEYVVILTLVGIGCVFALLAAGTPLVLLYEAQTTWISIGVL